MKLLPAWFHAIADYGVGIALIVGPFVVGFDGSSGGLTAFYIAASVAVLAVSLITNYQYSPRRQVSAAVA